MEESFGSLSIIGFVVLFVELAVVAGIYVWQALALAGMFRKTGSEPWKGWVPIVREWELLRLARMNPIWAIAFYVAPFIIIAISTAAILVFVLELFNNINSTPFNPDSATPLIGLGMATFLIPFFLSFGFFVLQLVIMILMVLRINTGFGLGGGYAALGVLVFPVWTSVLAWGNAQWRPGDGQGPRIFGTPPGAAPEHAAQPPAPMYAQTPAAPARYAPPQQAPVAPSSVQDPTTGSPEQPKPDTSTETN